LRPRTVVTDGLNRCWQNLSAFSPTPRRESGQKLVKKICRYLSDPPTTTVWLQKYHHISESALLFFEHTPIYLLLRLARRFQIWPFRGLSAGIGKHCIFSHLE